VSAPGLQQDGATLTRAGSLAGGQQAQFIIVARVNAQAPTALRNEVALSGDGQSRTLAAPDVAISRPGTGGSKTVYLPIVAR
jgi:hypothetical protein